MTAIPLHPRPGLGRRLGVAVLLVALLLGAQAFPSAVRAGFCAPSAWLSAQFLGVAMHRADDGFRLDCMPLPVDVTLTCSGTTFFAMLLTLLLALPPRLPRGPELALTLALTYAIALAANTARIVLGWHAAVWANTALPESFHSGVHLAVGIVVFSSALVAGVLAMQMIRSPTTAAPSQEGNCAAMIPSLEGCPQGGVGFPRHTPSGGPIASSNQHPRPMPNEEQSTLGRWKLNVGCWKFPSHVPSGLRAGSPTEPRTRQDRL